MYCSLKIAFSVHGFRFVDACICIRPDSCTLNEPQTVWSLESGGRACTSKPDGMVGGIVIVWVALLALR